MHLRRIFEQALREIDPVTGLDDLVEFPELNMSMKINRNEKKLVLFPMKKEVPTAKVRVVIQMIKQEFDDARIQQLAKGEEKDIFEITFEPTEDFEAVVDFVKNQIDRERQ